MKMYRSNLESALVIAIKSQRLVEVNQGFTADSCFVDGLREVFDASRRGEDIEIVNDKKIDYRKRPTMGVKGEWRSA